MYQSNIHKAKKRTDREDKNRTLIAPEEDQMYGVVKRMLGNGRVEVYCQNEKLHNGLICGSMRNRKVRVIIEPGNLVIVSHRIYEDKIDVVYKYTADEMNQLVRYSILPEAILKNISAHDIAGRDVEEDTNIVYEEIDGI